MEVADAVAQRWSPRAYDPKPVSDADLTQIFEAGRSAHSCNNEQPWRFLIAKKNAGPARETLESFLAEGNAYAKNAWILGISFGKKTFTRNSKPNRHDGHDVGAASQAMSLRAFSMGINMRFMAGFDAEAAAKLAPPDFEPFAMFVIGYKTAAETKPPRTRNPLGDQYFENEWGNSWKG